MAELVGHPEPSRATVQRVLEELVSAGVVERVGAGRKGSPYCWRLLPLLSAHPTDEVRAETIWAAPTRPAAAGYEGTATAPTLAIHSAHTQTLTGAERIETVEEWLAERATDDDAEAWP